MDHEFKQCVLLTAVKQLRKAYKPAFGYVTWRQSGLVDCVKAGYLESEEVVTKGRHSYMLKLTKKGKSRLSYLMGYFRDDRIQKELDVTLKIYRRTMARIQDNHETAVRNARSRDRCKMKDEKEKNDMADAIIELLQDKNIRQLVERKLKERNNNIEKE